MPVSVVLTDHHDDAVGPFRDHQRVDDDVHRRQVQKDIVKHVLVPVQQRVHTLGAQQLGRVRRDVPGRQNVPVVKIRGLAQAVALDAESGQQVRQARRRRHLQLLGDGRQAHVPVDQQHPLARLGQGVGQVHRGGGLAFAADRACDADDAAFLFRQSEEQIRPQKLIGFRRGEAQLVAQQTLLLPAGGLFFFRRFLFDCFGNSLPANRLFRGFHSFFVCFVCISHQSTPPFLALFPYADPP